MDPKLTTYTKASFATYFEIFCSDNDIDFTIDVLDSSAARENSDYINLKVGAKITPVTGAETKVSADIVILLHYIIPGDRLYRLEELKGAILVAINECIPLMEKGFEDSDDSIIEYFKLKEDARVFDLTNKDQTSRARESVFMARFETSVLSN